MNQYPPEAHIPASVWATFFDPFYRLKHRDYKKNPPEAGFHLKDLFEFQSIITQHEYQSHIQRKLRYPHGLGALGNRKYRNSEVGLK